MTARARDCCGDPSKCWPPCGILGKSVDHVSRSRFYGMSRPDTTLALPSIAAAPVAPRKVGWLERLIAGPQGDPDLRSDFYSFLGCLACGTGLALLLIALMAAGHWVLEGWL